MRNLRIALFTVASLLALSTSAQTVDEVVDKHLEALGGKDKLSSIKTLRMETNLTIQGMDVPTIVTNVHNVGQRIDISVMGTENYFIVTPTAGWTFIPAMGQTAPQAIPDAELKVNQQELDIQNPLLNYKDKGHKLELLGKETIDGKEAFKVKMISKSGFERTMFFDAQTYHLARIQQKAFVMGAEQDQTIIFSDYKKTEDGYLFPYTISGIMGGDMVVSKVEVNKPVDEKIFKVN